MEKKLTNNAIIARMIFIIFVITVLSQVPYFKRNNISELLNLVWILPLPFVVFDKKIRSNKHIRYLIKMYLVWIFLITIFTLITPNTYFYESSWSFRGLSMTLFLIYIGYYISKYIDEERFMYILSLGAIIAAPILCITLYFDSFQDYDINSREYGYIGKNSISQILISCFILIAYLFKSKNYVIKLFKWIVLVTIVAMMLIIKSRASIMGFFVIIFVDFFILRNFKEKKIYMLIILLSLIYVVSFTNIINTIFYSVLLAGRDVNDINDISSGRVYILSRAVPRIFNDILTGNGSNSIFVESFPIAILVEYGIIAGTLIFFIVLKPLLFSIRYCKWDKPLDVCFKLLIFVYYLNSLFEQQAPIGPGTKCFMLWFIFGYIIYRRSNLYNNRSEIKKAYYINIVDNRNMIDTIAAGQ